MAAEHALRGVDFPALDFRDKLLQRDVVRVFHKDHETAIIALRNGYSPVMRHISRTNGVDL